MVKRAERTLVVAIIGVVILFELVLTLFIGSHPLVIAFLALMALMLMGFHSLKVDVNSERIRLRFGWGISPRCGPGDRPIS